MAKMSSRRLSQTWPFERHNKFERKLRSAASKWFSSRGFTTQINKSYCLKSYEEWYQNIICTDVVDYIRNENERYKGKEPFPLHKSLHHGLSSQAMLFNLLGPLIVRDDLEPLQIAIERAGTTWPAGKVSYRFECSDRTVFNEDIGQPTSIDLAISGKISNLFIEAKLVEKEFGICSIYKGDDCDGRNPIKYGFDGCYLHHIGRRYWEWMEEFGFDKTVPSTGSICPFVSYYQFFREVLFSLVKGGNLVLLDDERSPTFFKDTEDGKESGLWPFLIGSAPTGYSSDFGRITIQQLVSIIDDSRRHNDWINKFKIKYGIE